MALGASRCFFGGIGLINTGGNLRMDVVNKRERSKMMSAIRSQNNRSTEMAFLEVLGQSKLRGWRRQYKVFGKPDFAFPEGRVAVFLDGCFWHCCPKCSTKPKSNHIFWINKLSRNQQRDRKVNRKLSESGWKIFRLWECDFEKRPHIVRRFAEKIRLSLAHKT